MSEGPRPVQERPFRILIVEDNPDDVTITTWAVRRVLRCEIEVVVDGEAAIAALRDREAGPDLILLDLRLPGMSGIDVLRWLRGEPAYRRTPVIMLTAAGDDDQAILESYATGVNSLLAKPATDARFAEALRILASDALRAGAREPLHK